MSITTIVTGALAANAITFAFIFGLWRLTKNDRDLTAYAIILVACAFGLMAALTA